MYQGGGQDARVPVLQAATTEVEDEGLQSTRQAGGDVSSGSGARYVQLQVGELRQACQGITEAAKVAPVTAQKLQRHGAQMDPGAGPLQLGRGPGGAECARHVRKLPAPVGVDKQPEGAQVHGGANQGHDGRQWRDPGMGWNAQMPGGDNGIHGQ